MQYAVYCFRSTTPSFHPILGRHQRFEYIIKINNIKNGRSKTGQPAPRTDFARPLFEDLFRIRAKSAS